MPEFAVGDLLKIVLNATYNVTESIQNRFFYEVVSINTTDNVENTLSLAGKAVWTQIEEPLRDITTAMMQYFDLQVSIINKTTFTEETAMTYNIPTGERAGQATGETLPPFVAWTYKYIRPSGQFRNGYKRFAGVNEGGQNNGIAISAQLTLLDALALALQATLDVESGIGTGTPGTIKPVLVHSQANGQLVRPVVVYDHGGVVYSHIGSQNTRKYGRGS